MAMQGIKIGNQFFPGWSTTGAEADKSADFMHAMSLFDQSQGLGAAANINEVGAQKLYDQYHTGLAYSGPNMYSGYSSPDTPVAPANQHNYSGPASNLAESFGINAQASAIRNQAAAAQSVDPSNAQGGNDPSSFDQTLTRMFGNNLGSNGQSVNNDASPTAFSRPFGGGTTNSVSPAGGNGIREWNQPQVAPQQPGAAPTPVINAGIGPTGYMAPLAASDLQQPAQPTPSRGTSLEDSINQALGRPIAGAPGGVPRQIDLAGQDALLGQPTTARGPLGTKYDSSVPMTAPDPMSLVSQPGVMAPVNGGTAAPTVPWADMSTPGYAGAPGANPFGAMGAGEVPHSANIAPNMSPEEQDAYNRRAAMKAAGGGGAAPIGDQATPEQLASAKADYENSVRERAAQGDATSQALIKNGTVPATATTTTPAGLIAAGDGTASSYDNYAASQNAALTSQHGLNSVGTTPIEAPGVFGGKQRRILPSPGAMASGGEHGTGSAGGGESALDKMWADETGQPRDKLSDLNDSKSFDSELKAAQFRAQQNNRKAADGVYINNQGARPSSARDLRSRFLGGF